MSILFGRKGGVCARALLTVLLAACLGLSGCASRGGKAYSDGEVRTVQRVQYGTVLDVSDVMVEEDPSLVGPMIGAAAGGVVGSLFGSGTGKTLAVLGGVALGAIGGGVTESQLLRRYPAAQITLELDNKDILVIVQGYDDMFVKGDRVRVISTDEGRARVQHM